jgi:heavy metal sensor kinase
LVAFGLLSYAVFSNALMDRTDHFIGDALAAFSRELVAERHAASSGDEALRKTIDEVRFRDLYIAIVDSTGRVAAATKSNDEDRGERHPVSLGPAIVTALRERGLRTPIATTIAAGAARYRVISGPLTLDARPFVVTGGYSLADIDDVLRGIRHMFALAIPFLILSAAIGGSFLAKRSLAPVTTMAARAAEISASTLHERLPVAGGDEVVRLARVVNDLLDRLETSFEQQRRFMADASHELRTPTAILRTEADVTLSRPHRSEDEYRASVAVMSDASRRLTRIVEELFLLARADSGHLVPRREPVYLEELLHDAVRGVHHLADQRAVRLSLGPMIDAPFNGDADLLGRLLLNLLDNAIKHSPQGGSVDVTMAQRNGLYEIAVIDAGAGIPAEAHDRVFERFFRVDVARSRTDTGATSGAGLGLAIARRIAELHGGRLDLAESRPGRTEFRMTLPA